MAICQPHDTTEICVKSNVLPATIIVCALLTHDQESVGTKIVAGVSVALIIIWCRLWYCDGQIWRHLLGYGGMCSNKIRWK